MVMGKYTIVVQPYKVDPSKDFGYCTEYKVISSDHPRFSVSSRYDFGFLSISVQEGAVVIFLPIKDGIA
jgi:hypothetical protein